MSRGSVQLGMEPIAYRIRCSAWECEPERLHPKSQPIEVQASTPKAAAAEARKKGWRPVAELDTVPSTRIRYWWCPFHVHQWAAGIPTVKDPARRVQLEVAMRKAGL